MQNVRDIKFLKARVPNVYERDFDAAFAELEVKITEHLKNGWVIKGEFSYIKDGGCLIQTMVKYEKTKEAEADLLNL